MASSAAMRALHRGEEHERDIRELKKELRKLQVRVYELEKKAQGEPNAVGSTRESSPRKGV